MRPILKLLRYVNSMPFSFTVKHYFPFDSVGHSLKNGDLISAESWDALRESHPHFSISTDREQWLLAANGKLKKDGQGGSMKNAADSVVRVLEKLKVTSLVSVGVGGAGLEYNINRLKPEINLTVSEYSRVSVDNLKKVFLESDNILMFDIKDGDWKDLSRGKDLNKTLFLMYRVDIGFSDNEWKNIFRNMWNAKIENILIVACGTLTARGLFNRIFQIIKWKFSATPLTFSGYLRTEKTLTDFWKHLYSFDDADCGGLRSFVLKRINNE